MYTTGSLVLKAIIESLDVPVSAYEAAKRRYKDLGKWLEDISKAKSARCCPHVSPQGSFRLGTVTRPWKHEDYDLDLACNLQEGITKSTHTQEQLKLLVGIDLENYRMERGIQEKLEEKPRCWRLNYQDDLKFHMDVVPAIPETETHRLVLSERMMKTGTDEFLARDVAKHAMAITDNKHHDYRNITDDWQISNEEGYAVWFGSRMRQAVKLLESRAKMEKVARVDVLPFYQWKTPLQQSIQILKRRRDIMFEADPDHKPISKIITTLAAWAYTGEEDVESALSRIVEGMPNFISPTEPRVSNPANPVEDFADKWPHDPRLEANFWSWLEQVKGDLGILVRSKDTSVLTEAAMRKFGASVDESKLRREFSLLEKAAAIASGAAHTASNGTIGTSGVKNPPHKFYGQSKKADS